MTATKPTAAPPEIWLDDRVAKGIPTEPDEEKAYNGVEQTRYFSADRVKELVDMSRGGPEFFVQIETEQTVPGTLFALTNYGRLYQRVRGSPWKAIDLPNLAGDNNAKMEI